MRLIGSAWSALELPIELVFFTTDRHGHVRARFPSPAGAVEFALDAQPESVARTLNPDVEALVVDRRAGRRAVYRASIDHAHRLVGLVRTAFRVGGATEIARVVADYFEELERCAERGASSSASTWGGAA